MLIEIHPDNPEQRKINHIIEVLQSGGVIIYPTDSVYGLGCDVYQAAAIEKLCRVRGLNPEKAQLTMLVPDISSLAAYVPPIDNAVFRMLKRNVPGPFTFIFNAGHEVSKRLKSRRKTIGVRIPENPIAKAIVEALGHPVLSISLKGDDDDAVEYHTDPFEIHNNFGNKVDLIIDGGPGHVEPTTIVDCTGEEPEILRQGAGILE